MSSVRTAVTHNGTFHPDDVFAAAVVKKLFPEITITRSRSEDVIRNADIVFDVGRLYSPGEMRFDHHQSGAPTRTNGIPYSSFGLAWKEFGLKFCDNDEEVAKYIDNVLVQCIDADDNGVEMRTSYMKNVNIFDVLQLIDLLNPCFGSDEDYDMQYRKAVELAEVVLNRLVEVGNAERLKRSYFRKCLAESTDPRYVILDKPGDYVAHAVKEKELLYIITPDTVNNTWGVTAVPSSPTSFELRRPLPAQWAGLEGDQLIHATGISGAVFCHLKRFYAVAKTRAEAIGLVDLSLRET